MFGEMLLHTIGGVYVASANRHLGKGTPRYYASVRHLTTHCLLLTAYCLPRTTTTCHLHLLLTRHYAPTHLGVGQGAPLTTHCSLLTTHPHITVPSPHPHPHPEQAPSPSTRAARAPTGSRSAILTAPTSLQPRACSRCTRLRRASRLRRRR